MEAFGYYLIKSAIWLSGFAIIYLLFLRNERFFMLKRIYLISGIVVSFIFPLITIHYQVELPMPVTVTAAQVQVTSASYSVIPQAAVEKEFNYIWVIAGLYLAGFIFLTIRLVTHFLMMFRTIKNAKINNRGPARLIRASEYKSSFSFFNYVFVSPSINENEVEEIMNHELVHVRQKHWFDLLLGETVRLVQWANPFAWIYTGFIRLNHEYLADEVALQHTSDPAIYKAALLNQMFKAPVISISNSFNFSLNKTRFDMMKKIITSPYRKLKVLLVLPVFAIIFYAFAKPQYRSVSPANNTMEIIQAPVVTGQTAGGEVQKENGPTDAVGDGDGTQETKPVAGVLTRGLPDSVLVIINGVPGDKKSLGEIDPNSIASISVLKDQSATAVFGNKGKNGVIVVTTKTPLQKPVKGIVLNEEGKPFGGVSILTTGAEGNASLVTTGPDGHFTISNVQQDAMLLLSFRGYKRMSLKPDFNSEMTVKMEKDPEYKAEQGPAQPQFQRPPVIVTVDGILTDKTPEQVRKELGYNYGMMNMSRPRRTDNNAIVMDTMKILTRKKALEMGLKPPFPRLSPDDYPTFRGQRPSSFNDWFMDQIKYPADATAQNIEGWVSVNFKIQLDGSMSDIQSTIPVNPILSDEVLRVVKSAPKWEPPKNSNVDEPLNQSVIVKFKLPDQILMEAPFVVVEQMPRYPGGDAELLKYIADNTVYPETAKAEKIQGRVIVRFIVSSEGKTEAISVLKGVHPLLDNEAIRVVGTVSGWQPGMQGGKPVNVWYMVPITFTLKEDNKKAVEAAGKQSN